MKTEITNKILKAVSEHDKFGVTQCDNEFLGRSNKNFTTFDIVDVDTDDVIAHIVEDKVRNTSTITILEFNYSFMFIWSQFFTYR